MQFSILVSSIVSLVACTLVACSAHTTSEIDVDQVLSVAEKQQLVTQHSTAFQALNQRIRDPFVLKGPDGYYYLTGTTADKSWGDTVGIRLWRSKDLAEWQDMGFVWDLYRDVPNRDSWHFQQPLRPSEGGTIVKNPIAVWAPEIHYMNGTWWIPYSLNLRGHGLLKSRSGKPEGPYDVQEPMSLTGIDSHLYQEDGKFFYMWGAQWLGQMNQEMTRFSEAPMPLEHNGRHPLGYEGILINKFGPHYVHIASGRYGYEPTNTYDLYYAISSELKGPYGKRRMAIKNAGHGNLFQGPNGKWWSTAFDHDFYNKKTMERWSLWLVPLEIDVSETDVTFHVLDKRFSPTLEDQQVVEQLSKSGVPEAWIGKKAWTLPEQLAK